MRPEWALLIALCLTGGAWGAPSGLRVRDVIAEVEARHPALRAARLEQRRAALAEEGEAARYRPTLIAEGGYTRSAEPFLTSQGIAISEEGAIEGLIGVTHQAAFGAEFGVDLTLERAWRGALDPSVNDPTRGPSYAAALTLRLRQPLLRGAGLVEGEAALREARLAASGATREAEAAASEALRDALVAYWALWDAQAAAGLARVGVEAAEAALEDARARLEVGRDAPLELTPFEVDAAEALEEALEADVALEAARLELGRHLGRPAAGLRALEPPPSTTPPLDPRLLEHLDGAYALVSPRLALRRAEEAAALAEARARPSLDARGWVAAYGLGDDDLPAALRMLGEGHAAAFAGLRLELPIADRRRAAEVARARLGVEAARARLEAARRAVEAEARASWARLEAARRRLALIEETARLAARSEAGQRARFEAGQDTATSVVFAAARLRRAQRRRVAARVAYAIQRARLLHALGGLLAALEGPAPSRASPPTGP